MLSYGTGEIAFVIAPCVYGGAEAKGAASFFQVMDKMDAVGQMMSKALALSGKVLKPVLNYTSKKISFVLEAGVKLYKTKKISVSFDRNTLHCGIPAFHIEIKNKFENLSGQELQKLKEEVANKINQADVSIDENGNKLIEVTIDGEKTTVIVGTDDGLDKIGGVEIAAGGSCNINPKNIRIEAQEWIKQEKLVLT